MCGIVGYVDFNKSTTREIIREMTHVLNHRGPNDQGTETYETTFSTIGMGHARLSIIDLSSAGHQPMLHKNLSIVFNGEIYNYLEIRKELEKLGHHFISNSDTEVILHAFDYWGVEFVNRLIGMFVITIYDAQSEKVFLFRDRAGVKPIFYYWNNGLFIFASELKAFHEHPGFSKVINNNALALYFDFGYIPAPYTIFENTYKIESGKFLTVNLKNKSVSNETYWNINDFYTKPKNNYSYLDAKEQVHNLLVSSCNYRMVADVPVGVFLSGGYDSTAVTAILQKERTKKLKTFTIGFEEGNNEAPFAKQTAKYFGTDHTEFICTTHEAQAIIPDLPFFYDEPFADSSAIPTILVSQVARKQVTVALSADGGDELFAGYTSYIKFDDYLKKINKIPDPLKSPLRPLMHFFSDLIPQSQPALRHKLRGIGYALNRDKFIQASELNRVSNSLPDSYMCNLFIKPPLKYSTKYNDNFKNFNNVIEIGMAIDYQMYLQDDILTKVDRATMSVSLEGREPLLDHRIAEFVTQLPLEYKFNNLTGKRILKDIVHDYIPKNMIDRPKTGFSLPIYAWLNGELSFLIDEYLNEKSISQSGLFNVKFVMSQVKLFRENKLHYKPFIWKLLMFQMWYFKWLN